MKIKIVDEKYFLNEKQYNLMQVLSCNNVTTKQQNAMDVVRFVHRYPMCTKKELCDNVSIAAIKYARLCGYISVELTCIKIPSWFEFWKESEMIRL
jgi:hypothetical protein